MNSNPSFWYPSMCGLRPKRACYQILALISALAGKQVLWHFHFFFILGLKNGGLNKAIRQSSVSGIFISKRWAGRKLKRHPLPTNTPRPVIAVISEEMIEKLPGSIEAKYGSYSCYKISWNPVSRLAVADKNMSLAFEGIGSSSTIVGKNHRKFNLNEASDEMELVVRASRGTNLDFAKRPSQSWG